MKTFEMFIFFNEKFLTYNYFRYLRGEIFFNNRFFFKYRRLQQIEKFYEMSGD